MGCAHGLSFTTILGCADFARCASGAHSRAVNAHLQQRAGAAFVTATATYGDKQVDGVASVKWESDAVQIEVVVYGLAVP